MSTEAHINVVGAKDWRLKQQRYSLVGEVCPHCDHKMFPPRDICTNCGGEAKQIYTFNGRGEVYSYTTIYEAPADYEEFSPYVEAWVKLEEGPLVTARLTDLSTHKEKMIIEGEEREIEVFNVNIGDKVEMVTRKLKENGKYGIITYGYMFRPRMANSSLTTEASMSSK